MLTTAKKEKLCMVQVIITFQNGVGLKFCADQFQPVSESMSNGLMDVVCLTINLTAINCNALLATEFDFRKKYAILSFAAIGLLAFLFSLCFKEKVTREQEPAAQEMPQIDT